MTLALESVDFVADQLPGAALHDLLARARDAGGLAETTMLGMPARVVARFADLKELFADAAQFPGGQSYQFMVEPAVGRTFISMDGDEHDTYRRLATPAFRSRRVTTFVDTELVPLAHEIVDRFAGRDEVDLVAEYARVLPLWAISRKLGLPMGSEERQRAWTAALLSHPVDAPSAERAKEEVAEFLAPLLVARRADPGDDVLSHLLAPGPDGARLTDEEIVNHVRLLYVVGAATTSDGLGSLLFHVLTRPELAARARAEPAFCERLVLESLRFEPPVSVLPRLSPAGGTLCGETIAPGTLLLCAVAAANRDPSVFDEPDRFDPDRDLRETLTFGFGPKFCPGAHLARRQMTAALAVLLERLPDLEVVDASEPVGSVLRTSWSVRARWSAS